jgi:hypothetical protein
VGVFRWRGFMVLGAGVGGVAAAEEKPKGEIVVRKARKPRLKAPIHTKAEA